MQGRNYAIDFIKCFAVFFVVCLHVAPFKNYYITDRLDLNFFIDTFARFAVPFFFVVSGYLIGLKTKNNPSSGAYFIKYTRRIAALFASWTVFYFVYDLVIFVLKKDQNRIKDISTLMLSVKTIYYGPPGTPFQLWYLLALMWSVVIIFVFVKLNKINYLLIGSLLLNMVGLFGQSYAAIAQLPLYDTRDALFFGLFYTTLGYWIASHYSIIEARLLKFPRRVYLILFVVFSITEMMERVLLFDPNHPRSGENYYISTIPLTLCLFLYALANKNMGKDSLITRIGENAVGIYVIHLFLINLTLRLMALLHYKDVLESVVWQLLFTPVIVAASYLTYLGLQKAKLKMKLLPGFRKVNTVKAQEL